MKRNAVQSGFTLFELLLVVAVVVILIPLLFGGFRPRRGGAMTVHCLSNQRQVCLGFIMWNGDNDSRYPWLTSTVTNGTMELITNGLASSQFLALQDYIKAYTVYVCPTDEKRTVATSMAAFANSNLSYFVSVDTPTNTPATVMIGDRHLEADGRVVKPGIFQFTNSPVMGWSRELHPMKTFETYGTLGFSDGHAQVVKGRDLGMIFRGQVSSGDRLEVP